MSLLIIKTNTGLRLHSKGSSPFIQLQLEQIYLRDTYPQTDRRPAFWSKALKQSRAGRSVNRGPADLCSVLKDDPKDFAYVLDDGHVYLYSPEPRALLLDRAVHNPWWKDEMLAAERTYLNHQNKTIHLV